MQKILVPLRQGQSLSTLLFSPTSAAKAALIVCHGFRGGKENGGQIFPFAEALNELGILVVAFDFSGCGESSGDFSQVTLSRQINDLKGISAFVQENYGLKQIALGRSFGGSTVIAAASCLAAVSRYILWSAPFDLVASFALILGQDYKRLIAGESVIIEDESGTFKLEPDLVQDMPKHDMLGSLQSLAGRPTLIVHGEDDEVVPVDNAREIAARLPEAVLHIVPGADHRFSEHAQQRREMTLNWVKGFI